MQDKQYNTPDNEVYSPEELEFFTAIESGEYEKMPQKEFEKQKQFYEQVAKNTLTLNKMNKKKNYTLRLNPTDVNNIKSMALQKGLPYQTFISSILHQVATKQIKV
jgi:predicted DNA binding CopG/RHH family protein